MWRVLTLLTSKLAVFIYGFYVFIQEGFFLNGSAADPSFFDVFSLKFCRFSVAPQAETLRVIYDDSPR